MEPARFQVIQVRSTRPPWETKLVHEAMIASAACNEVESAKSGLGGKARLFLRLRYRPPVSRADISLKSFQREHGYD